MKQLPRTLFVGGVALSLSAMSAALHAQDNLGNLEALIFEASHSEVTMTDDGVARIGWTRADVPVMVWYSTTAVRTTSTGRAYARHP